MGNNNLLSFTELRKHDIKAFTILQLKNIKKINLKHYHRKHVVFSYWKTLDHLKLADFMVHQGRHTGDILASLVLNCRLRAPSMYCPQC